MRAIIGLLHADMHQKGTVGSVGHLATSVITVTPGTKPDEAVAKITKRLKSGKVLQDVGVSFGQGLFSVPMLLKMNAVFGNCLSLFSGRGFLHQRGSYGHSTEQDEPTLPQTVQS